MKILHILYELGRWLFLIFNQTSICNILKLPTATDKAPLFTVSKDQLEVFNKKFYNFWMNTERELKLLSAEVNNHNVRVFSYTTQ